LVCGPLSKEPILGFLKKRKEKKDIIKTSNQCKPKIFENMGVIHNLVL